MAPIPHLLPTTAALALEPHHFELLSKPDTDDTFTGQGDRPYPSSCSSPIKSFAGKHNNMGPWRKEIQHSRFKDNLLSVITYEAMGMLESLKVKIPTKMLLSHREEIGKSL